MSVITRFAPSPTGYFHAGSYRTALFACIFARQNNGKFILRIEDTDKIRSRKEYEDNILESLEWMGLKYDELYRQSDRTEIYKKYIKRLIDNGHAFISNELPTDEQLAHSGKTRREVIRFKNPNKKVSFDDMIRGRVEFDTTELGDFVIAKSLEEPIFHLAVVIDDYDSGITHVIRGEDHISNTPRQILIYEALGAPVPRYAHIPLLLAKNRSKLSKRHGTVPITEYRQRGFLPEAVVNYLALLGWHPHDDREILTFNDLLKEFSLERVQKGGAVFDETKLLWFNREYIVRMTINDFINKASPFLPEWLSSKDSRFEQIIGLIKEKIYTLLEIEKLFAVGGELHFLKETSRYSIDNLLWKKNPNPIATKKHLNFVLENWENIADSDFTQGNLKNVIWSYAEMNGKGDVLWPLRMALTGQEKSPDPFICGTLLGKNESLKRIMIAINTLK